jgi:dihydroflavonol-4-reductase
VVTLGTTTYFDFKTSPLTETSPFDPHASGDPYTVTKGAAFLETMRRAEAGLDVSVVIPGGTFGPAPTINRAMEAPSFNLRIVWALLGKFDAAVSFPIPWSLAADVAYASIAALDRGVRGEKYLAFAGNHEVSTMATFCNRACEIAGVEHRVNEITAADLDASEEVRQRVGPSLIALAHQQFPKPYFVNDTTVERLDYQPRPLDDSLRETVEWLYHHDLVQ